jgi:hypothetical protein
MSKREPEDLLLDAQLSNLTTDGVGLTLFVGGSLISGTAVPLSTYVRTVFTDPASLEIMTDGLAAVERSEHELRDLQSKEVEQLTKQERKKLGQPRYFINLINAQWQAPTGEMAPTNQTVNVRVRASSVDAWTMGTAATSVS